jgi:hypothetical protein
VVDRIRGLLALGMAFDDVARFAAVGALLAGTLGAFLLTRHRAKAGLPPVRALAFLMRVMVNLKFAVALLLVIAAAAIVGTVIGGAVGEEAQARFFASLPFSALMVVFMVALILAVLSRYPWKRTHAGWIVTHTGLVIIVIGHMFTQHLGVSGRVDLREGESTTEVEGDRWFLTADLPGHEGGTRVTIPAALEEAPDTPLERVYRLPSGDKLTITRYFPNFAVRRTVAPDWGGPEPLRPAVRVEVADRKLKHSEWLFADDSQESAKTFGGAFTALYRRFPDAAALDAALAPATAPSGPAIVAEGGPDAPAAIDVAAAAAGPAPLGASGFAVHVLRRYERLRIGENQKAIDAPEGPLNEAVEVEVSGPDGASDRRWLFARMPEADTQGKIALPWKLRLRPAGGDAAALPPASVAILEAPEAAGGAARVLAVVTDPEGRHEARPLALGAWIPLPWVGKDVSLAVLDRYLRTREEETPWCATYSPNRPALEVALDRGDGAPPARTWVVWQKPARPTVLRGREGPVRLSFGPETWPLGFSVQLQKFVLKTYEGTDNPMSFESFVRVVPEDGEPAFDYHIYMNHVMDAGSWRFFQSSYDPETLKRSIFQVSHDPGKGVVYLGYLLTPLGLLFIVFVKPWLVSREAARRAAAGLAARDARAQAAAVAAADAALAEADPAASLELADQALEKTS